MTVNPNQSALAFSGIALFRSYFNNWYIGGRFYKGFATPSRKYIDIANVYFSIGGTSQPETFVRFLQDVGEDSDGLEDRFLQVFARASSEQIPDS